MNENESDIQKVEVTIDQAKAAIARRDTLAALQKNPEFKQIILTDYIEQEAIRLVHAKAIPAMADKEHQKGLDRSISAISELVQYLNRILQHGAMAEKALAEAQETHSELLGEAH